jgi:asparaginyl-tRNA synthetase
MSSIFSIKNNYIHYSGNKHFKGGKLDSLVPKITFRNRISQIQKFPEFWENLLIIDAELQKAINNFFQEQINALQVDIPALTRSISSPGSLGEKKIISDVNPFYVDYFNHSKKLFLSQSSQLYLEAYILMTNIQSVYNIGKSFRNEVSDFRHLTEFRQVEFEGLCNFRDILSIQEDLIKFLINHLIQNVKDELLFFVDQTDLDTLIDLINLPFISITFEDAFMELYKYTGDPKYDKTNYSIRNFDAKSEILLNSSLGKKNFIFVTHYPIKEVAFYHKQDIIDSNKAVNADLIFPSYGEIIGSGERIHTKKEYLFKRNLFDLDKDDYDWYGNMRKYSKNKINSGFGMGIERFVCAILKLPHIGLTIPFPRISSEIYP